MYSLASRYMKRHKFCSPNNFTQSSETFNLTSLVTLFNVLIVLNYFNSPTHVMSDNIMLSLINNNRPNHKPPPPPCSFNDVGGGTAPSGLNPLVKPFAPRSLSGETVINPLHAALRAARARAEQQVGDDEAS